MEIVFYGSKLKETLRMNDGKVNESERKGEKAERKIAELNESE